MSWKNIIKAPPIRNPRELEFREDNSNDDLSMTEYERLFERVVDPVIREAGEKKKEYADIKLTELQMSGKKAKEVAKELYADMGYGVIFIHNNSLLTFNLTEVA